MNHNRSKRKTKNRKKSPKKSPKSKSQISKSPPKQLNEDELVSSLMKAFSTVWFERSGSTVASSVIGSSVKHLSAASSSGSTPCSFGIAPLPIEYSTRKGKAKCEYDAGSVLESDKHFGDSPERSWSEVVSSPPLSVSQSRVLSSPITALSVAQSLFHTPETNPLKIFAEKHGGKSVQDNLFVHGEGNRQSQSQSQWIFEMNNQPFNNMLKMDLHGQQLKPALERVKSVISLRAYLALRKLVAVTGKGLHSKENPVIKDAVIDLLTKGGIPFKILKENEGSVEIDLAGPIDFSLLDD